MLPSHIRNTGSHVQGLLRASSNASESMWSQPSADAGGSGLFRFFGHPVEFWHGVFSVDPQLLRSFTQVIENMPLPSAGYTCRLLESEDVQHIFIQRERTASDAYIVDHLLEAYETHLRSIGSDVFRSDLSYEGFAFMLVDELDYAASGQAMAFKEVMRARFPVDLQSETSSSDDETALLHVDSPRSVVSEHIEVDLVRTAIALVIDGQFSAIDVPVALKQSYLPQLVSAYVERYPTDVVPHGYTASFSHKVLSLARSLGINFRADAALYSEACAEASSSVDDGEREQLLAAVNAADHSLADSFDVHRTSPALYDRVLYVTASFFPPTDRGQEVAEVWAKELYNHAVTEMPADAGLLDIPHFAQALLAVARRHNIDLARYARNVSTAVSHSFDVSVSALASVSAPSEPPRLPTPPPPRAPVALTQYVQNRRGSALPSSGLAAPVRMPAVPTGALAFDRHFEPDSPPSRDAVVARVRGVVARFFAHIPGADEIVNDTALDHANHLLAHGSPQELLALSDDNFTHDVEHIAAAYDTSLPDAVRNYVADRAARARLPPPPPPVGVAPLPPVLPEPVVLAAEVNPLPLLVAERSWSELQPRLARILAAQPTSGGIDASEWDDVVDCALASLQVLGPVREVSNLDDAALFDRLCATWEGPGSFQDFMASARDGRIEPFVLSPNFPDAEIGNPWVNGYNLRFLHAGINPITTVLLGFRAVVSSRRWDPGMSAYARDTWCLRTWSEVSRAIMNANAYPHLRTWAAYTFEQLSALIQPLIDGTRPAQSIIGGDDVVVNYDIERERADAVVPAVDPYAGVYALIDDRNNIAIAGLSPELYGGVGRAAFVDAALLPARVVVEFPAVPLAPAPLLGAGWREAIATMVGDTRRFALSLEAYTWVVRASRGDDDAVDAIASLGYGLDDDYVPSGLERLWVALAARSVRPEVAVPVAAAPPHIADVITGLFEDVGLASVTDPTPSDDVLADAMWAGAAALWPTAIIGRAALPFVVCGRQIEPELLVDTSTISLSPYLPDFDDLISFVLRNGGAADLLLPALWCLNPNGTPGHPLLGSSVYSQDGFVIAEQTTSHGTRSWPAHPFFSYRDFSVVRNLRVGGRVATVRFDWSARQVFTYQRFGSTNCPFVGDPILYRCVASVVPFQADHFNWLDNVGIALSFVGRVGAAGARMTANMVCGVSIGPVIAYKRGTGNGQRYGFVSAGFAQLVDNHSGTFTPQSWGVGLPHQTIYAIAQNHVLSQRAATCVPGFVTTFPDYAISSSFVLKKLDDERRLASFTTCENVSARTLLAVVEHESITNQAGHDALKYIRVVRQLSGSRAFFAYIATDAGMRAQLLLALLTAIAIACFAVMLAIEDVVRLLLLVSGGLAHFVLAHTMPSAFHLIVYCLAVVWQPVTAVTWPLITVIGAVQRHYVHGDFLHSHVLRAIWVWYILPSGYNIRYYAFLGLLSLALVRMSLYVVYATISAKANMMTATPLYRRLGARAQAQYAAEYYARAVFGDVASFLPYVVERFDCWCGVSLRYVLEHSCSLARAAMVARSCARLPITAVAYGLPHMPVLWPACMYLTSVLLLCIVTSPWFSYFVTIVVMFQAAHHITALSVLVGQLVLALTIVAGAIVAGLGHVVPVVLVSALAGAVVLYESATQHGILPSAVVTSVPVLPMLGGARAGALLCHRQVSSFEDMVFAIIYEEKPHRLSQFDAETAEAHIPGHAVAHRRLAMLPWVHAVCVHFAVNVMSCYGVDAHVVGECEIPAVEGRARRTYPIRSTRSRCIQALREMAIRLDNDESTGDDWQWLQQWFTYGTMVGIATQGVVLTAPCLDLASIVQQALLEEQLVVDAAFAERSVPGQVWRHLDVCFDARGVMRSLYDRMVIHVCYNICVQRGEQWYRPHRRVPLVEALRVIRIARQPVRGVFEMPQLSDAAISACARLVYSSGPQLSVPEYVRCYGNPSVFGSTFSSEPAKRTRMDGTEPLVRRPGTCVASLIAPVFFSGLCVYSDFATYPAFDLDPSAVATPSKVPCGNQICDEYLRTHPPMDLAQTELGETCPVCSQSCTVSSARLGPSAPDREAAVSIECYDYASSCPFTFVSALQVRAAGRRYLPGLDEAMCNRLAVADAIMALAGLEKHLRFIKPEPVPIVPAPCMQVELFCLTQRPSVRAKMMSALAERLDSGSLTTAPFWVGESAVAAWFTVVFSDPFLANTVSEELTRLDLARKFGPCNFSTALTVIVKREVTRANYDRATGKNLTCKAPRAVQCTDDTMAQMIVGGHVSTMAMVFATCFSRYSFMYAPSVPDNLAGQSDYHGFDWDIPFLAAPWTDRLGIASFIMHFRKAYGFTESVAVDGAKWDLRMNSSWHQVATQIMTWMAGGQLPPSFAKLRRSVTNEVFINCVRLLLRVACMMGSGWGYTTFQNTLVWLVIIIVFCALHPQYRHKFVALAAGDDLTLIGVDLADMFADFSAFVGDRNIALTFSTGTAMQATFNSSFVMFGQIDEEKCVPILTPLIFRTLVSSSWVAALPRGCSVEWVRAVHYAKISSLMLMVSHVPIVGTWVNLIHSWYLAHSDQFGPHFETLVKHAKQQQDLQYRTLPPLGRPYGMVVGGAYDAFRVVAEFYSRGDVLVTTDQVRDWDELLRASFDNGSCEDFPPFVHEMFMHESQF